MFGKYARVLAVAAVCAVATLMFWQPGPAAAQESGVEGTWESIEGRQGARAGKTDHGLEDGTVFTADQESETWTLTVDKTQDAAFHGEWCSPKKCEGVVGVVSGDGTLHAVDHDGVFRGTRVGDTMELCYLEPGEEFRVADCHMLRRQ
jgi:hypothetical protein